MSVDTKTHSHGSGLVQFFEDLLSLNDFYADFIQSRKTLDQRVRAAAKSDLPTKRDLISIDMCVSHHSHEWAKVLSDQMRIFSVQGFKLDKISSFVEVRFTSDIDIKTDILTHEKKHHNQESIQRRREILLAERTTLIDRIEQLLLADGGRATDLYSYNPQVEFRPNAIQIDALEKCYDMAIAIFLEQDEFQKDEADRQFRRRSTSYDRYKDKEINEKSRIAHNTHLQNLKIQRRSLREAVKLAYSLGIPFDVIGEAAQRGDFISREEFTRALLSPKRARSLTNNQ